MDKCCVTIKTFLTDTRGAVSVDWVVLSAALVGLGLSVLAVASGGVENLSGDTAEELAGTSIQTRFSTTSALFETDFSAGAGGWFNGTLVDLPGFGEVLQLDDGELAEVQVMVPAGATSATIQFDLIGADDLNGATATVYVNGEAVSVYRDNHGNVSIVDGGGEGISVSVTQEYSNNAAGAGTHGHDSRASYEITVDNPGSSLTFGVQSGANDGIADEFYAIDNVNISSS